ncbi:hypothetical protein KAFR_0D01860 [Kazachstania africana CBS 2517]|uniref:serine C-palmitoyltransferase n=1 Tax=Kazachstania africana (strain ATCC 22294 / BCRC 22015 / CBS 2517 / CECT 1963 / NBRC 1671 / NRRL Y-8276) TaxID=1071382 RepID=H2ATY3_KAZAF|nr:hypothetical protein KAFR_0D01860 [Kazachstania africana CBS 2517]CCF57833.1 hypothetical protein KAFR_0D01860 [Kazachstania africana CBS 2517]
MNTIIPEVLPSSIPIPEFVVTSFSYTLYFLHLVLNRVPGGHYVTSYLSKSTHDDPYRTAVEIGLILYGIYYYLSKPQQRKGLQSNRPNLTPAEIDNLIDEWEPEPITDAAETRDFWRLAKIPVVIGSGANNYINFTRDNDKERFENVFNLTSMNFLQLSKKDEVVQVAKQTIKNYGVGACGPAGFYGNQDVHNNLEYNLAKFFNTEGAVLYGQDFCVSPSVIPAFTKRGDVIIADNQVSLSLQNALQLSRSTVYYFEHNDMEHLDAMLTEINESEKRENLPAIPRKFIVTEGIFHNSGDIAPLPDLVRLKLKHKFRLFVDETLSLGVLGKTGRGLTEHFNMDRASSVDITVGSMAVALGSSGGFALGDKVMSNHQHIGSNAYCFSACLPAYTTTAVSKVLEIMDNDNSAVSKLQRLSKLLFDKFNKNEKIKNFFEIISDENSPILHLKLNDQFRSNVFGYTQELLYDTMVQLQKKSVTNKYFEPSEMEEKFLQDIVDDTLKTWNVLITRNIIIAKHETLPIVPSLKICCNSEMTEEELTKACDNIVESMVSLCSTQA